MAVIVVIIEIATMVDISFGHIGSIFMLFVVLMEVIADNINDFPIFHSFPNQPILFCQTNVW